MKTNTDIILVNPTLTYEELYGGVFASGGNHHVSIGLPYLAAVIRDNGYKVEIIDGIATQISIDDIVKTILEKKPRFIGLTGVSIQIFKAAEIAKKVKEGAPDITTVIGGAHFSALPMETMERFPQFDMGVYGEGELTIVELMKAVDSKSALDHIKGIVFRAAGGPKKNPPRPLIENLDTLPMPAWNLLPELKKYYGPPADSLNRLPASALMASRGCPYQCTFCDRSVFGNRCRIHSPQYIMKMIEKLYHEYGIREIVFNDDNFIVFKKQLVEFCNLLIASKMKVSWICLGSVNIADEELLKLMKKSGCWQIMWGIETGSEDLLKLHKKPANLDQVRKALALSRKVGIRNKAFFILGLFHETEKTLQQTLDFMVSLPLDEMHCTYLQLYPNTEVWHTADKYGTFSREWEAMGAMTPNFVPFDLTSEVMEKFQKLFYIKFYFRPRIIWYFLMKCRRPAIAVKIFRTGFDFLKVVLMAIGIMLKGKIRGDKKTAGQ
jgi:radical SAM superfamily enzyme YgiQ (UPF0313 family)